MKVIGFGDNVVDKFLDRRVMYPGGNSLNVAVFAARLGRPAAYLGVFGDDAPGHHIADTLKDEGVDVSRCVFRPGETCWCAVETVDGDRRFLGWNEGGVAAEQPLRVGDAELDYLAEFGLVHSSGYAGYESVLPALRPLPGLVSFDFSDDAHLRTPEYLDTVCPYVDLALFSCSGTSAEGTRDLLAEAVRRGAGCALGTRGTDGSVFFDGARFHEAPAEPVTDPLDTMGCGDAFVTAFMLGLAESGWTRTTPFAQAAVGPAMREAAAFAAECVRTEGAFGHGVRF